MTKHAQSPSELLEPRKGRILIVDDEPHQRAILLEAVTELGYEGTTAETGLQAMEKLRFEQYDALLTDLRMPSMDGVRLVENARALDPTVSIIVATAHGSIETAVEAMRSGAEDYLLKPIELEALEFALARVFDKRELVRKNRQLQTENEELRRELGIQYHVTEAIGRSAASQKLSKQIGEASRRRTPLLLLGEPGAELEDLARMVHFNGASAQNSLIFFDCGSIPEPLQEAHLFGEEMPAAVGARPVERPGLVERAHLGTLVIASVHLLSSACQARLVRVLGEERTLRISGSKFRPVNVRIIATAETHEFERVGPAGKDKTFRRDLHQALFSERIEVPALRERKEDIPLLIAATARRAGLGVGRPIEKVERALVEVLVARDYPGNLRELVALVEAAVLRCTGPELKLEHLAEMNG